MSYSVRLRRRNDSDTDWETVYEFAVNPFLSPSITYEHDDQEPPLVSASKVTWKLTAKLLGSDEEAVKDAWLELRAAIEAVDTPAQGVQLLHNGTVVEEVSSEGGYDECKIESLGSPESDQQWTTEVVAVVVVSGVKRVDTGGLGGGISLLTQTLSYSYGESGLVTKTLDGEVTVTTGFSAEEIARTLGLELPSTSFAYVTRGPEGVDVEILNRADTKAHFTSVVRESGKVLPGGVGPSFSVEVETVTIDGIDVVTTKVDAEGPEAVAAVKSKRPSSRVAETQRYNEYARTASAVYIQKKTAIGANVMKRRSFTTSGGGRITTWSVRNGGRKPTRHYGSFAPVIVDEVLTLERTGGPDLLLTALYLPDAITADGLEEDIGGFRVDGAPDMIEKGKDASGDRYQIRVHRRYTADGFPAAFAAVAASSLLPQFNTSVNLAVERIKKGKD